MCKNIIFFFKKKSSKRNQNPSRYYYNSIITNNLKFQHKPKLSSFQTSSYKNRPILYYYQICLRVEISSSPLVESWGSYSWKFILTIGWKLSLFSYFGWRISILQKLFDFVWADNSSNFMIIIIIIINLNLVSLLTRVK